VINLDAALGQELFDIAVRQPVAEIPAHRQQDHLRQETEARKRRRPRLATATTNHPGTLRPAPDPSTQQCPHKTLFACINELRSKGWTFVFLGANQDSYTTGAQLAMPAGDVSNFRADAVGVAAMTDGLSRSVAEWRRKPRDQRRRDGGQFWGGKKEAETVLGSTDR
jgi:hypothetical protein